MRVFVLSTGRCGSTTFFRACRHLTNYTAGHESRASRQLFDSRFQYPDNHIECDNRLSWFLGELGERFDDGNTLYVHLTRDAEAVARSFQRRWDSPWPGSIIRAFGFGVLMADRPWPDEDVLDVCRFYVATVNKNIAEFVRTRPSMTVRVENAVEDFTTFLNRIAAEGDVAAAIAEWSVRYNASV